MYKHPCNITEKQAKTAFCGKKGNIFLQCYPDRTNCLDCDEDFLKRKKNLKKKHQHFGNIIGISDTLLHRKISFRVLQIRTNTRNVLNTRHLERIGILHLTFTFVIHWTQAILHKTFSA